MRSGLTRLIAIGAILAPLAPSGLVS